MIVYAEENVDLLDDLDREVEGWDFASPAYDNPFHEAEVEVATSDCDRSTHAEEGGQSPGHHASLGCRGHGCRAEAEEGEEAKAVMRWSRGRHR